MTSPKVGSKSKHCRVSSTKSCERRNDWSRQTSNAFSAFSTACWQWNRQSSVSGGSRRWTLSARHKSLRLFLIHASVSSTWIGSGCIEQHPFPQYGRGQGRFQMEPAVEVAVGPDQEVTASGQSLNGRVANARVFFVYWRVVG